MIFFSNSLLLWLEHAFFEKKSQFTHSTILGLNQSFFDSLKKGELSKNLNFPPEFVEKSTKYNPKTLFLIFLYGHLAEKINRIKPEIHIWKPQKYFSRIEFSRHKFTWIISTIGIFSTHVYNNIFFHSDNRNSQNL